MADEVQHPPRVLLAKIGLDGHDRGVKVLARSFRDAGIDVIYTGLWQTVEATMHAALQEDVDVVGLSLLSGAHNELFARVAELLRAEGGQSIVLFAGGTIPKQDIPHLQSLGFSRVFTPGVPLAEILSALDEELADGAAAGGDT